MSDVASPDFLLDTRGVTRDLGAYVVGAAFDAGGTQAAFALGDGTLRCVDVTAPEEWRTVAAHDGAVLALAAGDGFVTGGDDGKLRRTDLAGAVSDIASFGSKWVEHVALAPEGKGGRVLACSVGKKVHVFDGAGTPLKVLEHPSTASGIAFDAKGKRIAVSHYNGASLWFVAAKVDSPRSLEWKGSHIGIVVSPDGDAVVTAMQESALHGWRLSDGQHMRMSGYPAKTESMGFMRNGKYLATSGADSVVLWPFFGGGPMGKPPIELAGGDGVLCSCVAPHPQHDALAAGFADGLVVLADVPTQRIVPVAAPGRGRVTALAWSASGAHLAIGGENGFAAVVDFSKRE